MKTFKKVIDSPACWESANFCSNFVTGTPPVRTLKLLLFFFSRYCHRPSVANVCSRLVQAQKQKQQQQQEQRMDGMKWPFPKCYYCISFLLLVTFLGLSPPFISVPLCFCFLCLFHIYFNKCSRESRGATAVSIAEKHAYFINKTCNVYIGCRVIGYTYLHFVKKISFHLPSAWLDCCQEQHVKVFFIILHTTYFCISTTLLIFYLFII